MADTTSTRVVIIGGGFAGIEAARRLAGESSVRVTLIDRRNHHLFQPLLYQVASAALSPADIARPIRAIFEKQTNCEVLLGQVANIDVHDRRIHLDHGSIDYDYCIVAVGAKTSYFGNNQWRRYAPGLKSIEDAVAIRRQVLLAFEAAERTDDLEEREKTMTFAVIGGGPTGVELAGAFAEIARYAMARDFRHIDPKSARIMVIEAADRLLLGFSEEAADRARQQLGELGVEILLNAKVEDMDAESILAGGERIACETKVWTAGVAANDVVKTLPGEVLKDGRIRVTEQGCLKDAPNVFVVGDCAARESEGKPVPGLAPAAMQTGHHAAACIRADLRRRERPRFRYRDKGLMATVGRHRAVAEFGSWRIGGFFAWVLWGAVHIAFLIGFRSKVMVVLTWIWNWLTFKRGARLITGEDPEACLPDTPVADAECDDRAVSPRLAAHATDARPDSEHSHAAERS